MDSPPPTGRVLVVSASMGAGHDEVAREMVRRLRELGCVTHLTDLLSLGRPGQGQRLRSTYAFLLDHAPAVYDLAMRWWQRWPSSLEAVTALGATAVEDDLAQLVRRVRPDAVVSVFNLASQCLGRLRCEGRIEVPVLTYVTDPGAHPYWVHPGVDAHLTVLEATAEALAAYGARQAVAVGPLVRPRFETPPEPSSPTGRRWARQELGLPADAVIALVSAGSWACGDLERTVRLLAEGCRVLPIALCGNDTGLRRRLDEQGGAIALGWVDDLAPLMRAADVLVDDAGGLTCFEALASGLPVLLFRPLPGHGRLNARTLEEVGAAVWVHDDDALLPLALSVAEPARRVRQAARAHALLAAGAGGDAALHVVDVLAARSAAGGRGPPERLRRSGDAELSPWRSRRQS